MANVTIGSKAVGSIVKIKVDGVLTDFIIAHQGLPGAMYDSSCDGTSVMGLNKLGPAAGGKKLPTREQLQQENQALKEKIKALEGQLEDTQLALCDVYEAMLTGGEL